MRNVKPFISSEQQVALDAIEQAFGVRLEAHQVLAMGVTKEWKKYRPDALERLVYQRELRSSDRLPWAEVLRQAYAQTASRRRSLAERHGKACGKVTARCYPGMPEEYTRRCHRVAGHLGVCMPSALRYPPAPMPVIPRARGYGAPR